MAGRERQPATPAPAPLATLVMALLLAGAAAGTAPAATAQHGAPSAPTVQDGTTAEPGNSTVENASVTFHDQAYKPVDQQVVVTNATLPDGGFVVLVDEAGRRRGATEYLDPGRHRDLVLGLDPPACDGATLTAVAYRDDGDRRLDEGNEPYRVDGARVDATAQVTPHLVAYYTFVNQTSDGDAVTVDQARIPDGGGFVVVGTTNDSLLADSQPPVVAERLGHSTYLEGSQQQVQVPLNTSRAGRSQLIAVTYADRDTDRTLDPGDRPAGPLCENVGYATALVRVRFHEPTPTDVTIVDSQSPTESSTGTETTGQSGFGALAALVGILASLAVLYQP